MAEEKNNLITVEAPKVNRSYEVEYDFAENLEDAVTAFGEDVVFSLYKAKAIIVLQDNIRRMMTQNKSDEEIAAFIEEWKPGVVQIRTGEKKKEKLLKEFTKMSAEQQKAMIEELMAKISREE